MLKSRSRSVRLFIVLSALASLGSALLAHGTAAAQSGDIIVGDGTPASCTETALRQALAVAEASGGGTIRFDCGGGPVAISLTETAQVRDIGPVLIVAPAGTTIDGGGTITLAGQAQGVVVFVAPETAAAVLKSLTITHLGTNFPTLHNEGTLTVSDSSISDNRFGGGIINEGTLTVTGSTIARNGGFLRGGIMNSGRLTLNDSMVFTNRGFTAGGLASFENADAKIVGSRFFDNSAEGDGGISNSGSLSIKDSEFTNNRGIFGDGAIGNAGSLDVKHSTFGANIGRQGGAGGIGNGGTLSVADSLFSQNAGGFGAAISHTGGTLTITQSDFSGNVALVSGGGIYNCAGTVDIKDSTITGNRAGQQGGGGIYTCSGSTTTLKDTLVRDNTPNDFAP